VGIAPTRTLAKLANYAAKKYTATGGVVDLTNPARQRRLMARVPVEEVWGVGRKLSARLQALGIVTALQLADTHLATLRKQFSVVLERTAQELNGIPCVPWEDVPPGKKQIMCSRSFGRPLQKLSDLEEAVAHFATRAAGKLRAGEQYVGELMVFIRTNPFKANAPQYSRSTSVKLIKPSQDSRVIVQQALNLLRLMYREGFDYAKAGVRLGELVSESGIQEDLFSAGLQPALDAARLELLMAVMDAINRKSGAPVYMAREAGPAAYAMRRGHLSPAYTTCWDELPTVL
jgi:DNA polymerase V